MQERESSGKVRDEFSDALNRVAYQGARIVLHRRGKDVAALIPVEDLELLEELENLQDLRDFRESLAEPGENIPWDEIRGKAEQS